MATTITLQAKAHKTTLLTRATLRRISLSVRTEMYACLGRGAILKPQ